MHWLLLFKTEKITISGNVIREKYSSLLTENNEEIFTIVLLRNTHFSILWRRELKLAVFRNVTLVVKVWLFPFLGKKPNTFVLVFFFLMPVAS